MSKKKEGTDSGPMMLAKRLQKNGMDAHNDMIDKQERLHVIWRNIILALTLALPIMAVSILAFGKYAYIGLIFGGGIMGFTLLWTVTEEIFRKLGLMGKGAWGDINE